MAKSTDAENPSMEQILQTIRGVISGEEGSEESSSEQKADNDDVLELTEMVEEDGSITSLEPEAESNAAPDVLANIDTALEEGTDTAENLENETAASQEVAATTETATDEQTAADDAPTENPPEKDETKAGESAAEEEISTDSEPANTLPEETEVSQESQAEPETTSEVPTDTTEEAPPPAEETSETNTEEAFPTTPESEEAATNAVITSEETDPVDVTTPEEPSESEQAKLSLISETTAQASTHALETLVRSLPKNRVDGPSFQSGLTLEELVVEALKPEIGTWLDKNLPALVTHIVEKEIKKLIPETND